MGNNGFILNIDASFGIPTDTGGPTYTPIGPADGTPMALRIFDESGTFTTITLPSSYSNYYNITGSPGAWSYAPNPAASGQQGNFVFYNLPVAPTGTGWYQIVLGSGLSTKTYNIYTQQTGAGTATFAFTDAAADGGAIATLISSGAEGTAID